MPRILLIDDDEHLAAPLAAYLQRYDFALDSALRPSLGLEKLRERDYDAAILDVMLPEMDGFALCREIRRGSDLPILMLTARGDVMDRVIGLELGADDYLPKPFEPRELLARIKALLRRASPQPDDTVLRFGRLEIDVNARQVRIDARICELTSYQFDILLVLAQSAGRVMSRDHIMDALKGHPMEAFDRSIDVHVSRIRAAIEDDPKTPRRILTVRGAGYVFARKQDGDGA